VDSRKAKRTAREDEIHSAHPLLGCLITAPKEAP